MKTPTEVVILVTAMVVAVLVELFITIGLVVSVVSLASHGPNVWNVAGTTLFGFLTSAMVIAMVRR